MTTEYPDAIDAFERPEGDDPMLDPSHSDMHDSVFEAIEAIETELGVNPAGSELSVADRLAAIEARLDILEA